MPNLISRPERMEQPAIRYFGLIPDEVCEIDSLLDDLAGRSWSPGDEEFLAQAMRWACGLPARLVDNVLSFRLRESNAALVLSGLPVNDEAIGPTPPDWRDLADRQRTRRHEFYLMLICALLGEVFGWSTLQDSRLIHNVLPMRAEEQEQSGHGTVQLEWHTEDGFHPFRCDYLVLLSMRNHDRVPTTISSIDDVSLSAEHRRVLGHKRFFIRPDNEHLHRAADLVKGTMRQHPIQVFHENPLPCEVLFGDPAEPYLRIDPAFMEALPGDATAASALRELVSQLGNGLQNVVLTPGDLLVVDNFKAVHGRSAFRARFDGTDRWLKKAVSSRDLRKSRASRASAGARVLL